MIEQNELEWLNQTQDELVLAEFLDQPMFISYNQFLMNNQGLWQLRIGLSDESPIKISSAFEVLGHARGPDGTGWGHYIRWKDPDGRKHQQFIAAAALQGDPGTLCAGLVDQGLAIIRTQQRNFQIYLDGVQTKQRVTRVTRTGWHEVQGKLIFALPHIELCSANTEHILLDAVDSAGFERRGSLDDWRNSVGRLCHGHLIPMLSISTALAGPLLFLSGAEGGGVNLFGTSSIGKTTALRAAASVWGRGGSPGFIRAWRATSNGLEGAAASSSDTLLVLDELGLIDAKELGVALYSLSNGSGKSRARNDGSLRELKSWRLMVLSSGELQISSKLTEERGVRVKAGQLIRIIDINADRGKGYGIFDHYAGYDEPGALAKAIKLASLTHYGSAGPEFVRQLMIHGINGEDIRASIGDFLNGILSYTAEPQLARAAERFALIAIAGELATTFGILPWQQGDASSAAEWAFKLWVSERGSRKPQEFITGIEQVRHFMEQFADSRFQDVELSQARIPNNRAGWVKGSGECRRWLIPPEIWKNDICKGLNGMQVAKYLAEETMLEKAPDGYQQVHKIEGQARRFYVLTPEIFAGKE